MIYSYVSWKTLNEAHTTVINLVFRYLEREYLTKVHQTLYETQCRYFANTWKIMVQLIYLFFPVAW